MTKRKAVGGFSIWVKPDGDSLPRPDSHHGLGGGEPPAVGTFTCCNGFRASLLPTPLAAWLAVRCPWCGDSVLLLPPPGPDQGDKP